jgi:predicted TIM-barrel fold metal-dependent hydrolase
MPVIDPHVHLALDDQMAVGSGPQSADDYLAATDGMDLRASGVLVMAPRGDLDRTRVQNDLVLDLSQRDERFFAVCSVHPADGDAAVAELDRVVAAGARGIKLHPNTQAFDVGDDDVRRVVAHAGERGVPVLFDAYSPFDPAQPGKFVELALGCPETSIILAHMHFMDFPKLLVYEVLARYPHFRRNVWFDMSATAKLFADSPYRDQFGWVCRTVGVDRLLWASDFPLDDPRESLASLTAYGFDEAETRQITHDNAARLFDLDG